MSFETTDPNVDIVFPDIESLEESATLPAQYQVPGVDLTSPAPLNANTLVRRMPTSKIRHLLAFATNALANYVSGLIDQARQDFLTPRPTQQSLQALRDQVADLTNQRDNAAAAAQQAQTDLDAANARIEQLSTVVPADPDLSTRFTELEAENTALIEDNVALQQQLNANQEEIIRLAAESDAHADTIRRLTTRNESLSSQLVEAQQVVPNASISNAPTNDLINPRDLRNEMHLAAVSAYYAYDDSSPPGIKFIAHGAATTNQHVNFFVQFAQYWLKPTTLPRSENVTQQFAHHMKATFETIVLDGQVLPHETSMLAACFNLHKRSDVKEISERKHTSCRFGHSCFFAQLIRDAPQTGTQHPSFSYAMCLSNFVREDLRPRRFPLSYSSFMRMIHSQKANQIISDVVERSPREQDAEEADEEEESDDE
jgi:outer membrane murein-binding lipoprotein Lpp